jgi:SAM-dependent methyltransferase
VSPHTTPAAGGSGVRDVPRVCVSCGGDRLHLHCHLARFDVYTCERCTIRFRHPLPDARELVEMYEDERYHESAYFQNAHEGYRESSPEIRIYRRALADLAALVPAAAADSPTTRRLLDVGCATGIFLDLARADGWDVAGVELSARHAAYARDAFGLEVWQGDFLAAPFPPGSFAAITMWDFLEHVLDPPAVLAQARRLLVPGGVLMIFTIDTSSLFNAAGDLLHSLSGGRVARPLELLYDYRHNYYFTYEALARLLAAESLRVVRWRADRAYLGRWLAEPAPWILRAGGSVLDLVSFAIGRPYRRTAFCVS